MRRDFLQVSGENFVRNGEKVFLRGFAIGSWMNLEHFMMGMPGTDEMMKEAFNEVYGAENSRRFFNDLVDAFVTEDDLAYLKSMGLNMVRLPFNYHWFLSDDAPGVYLENGFARLDRVLGYCRKYDLMAVLDLHSTPGGQNPDWHSDNPTGQSLFWKYKCFQTQMVDLWREIARRYADDPIIAGYDILNEPAFGLTAEQFNGFYDAVIAAIREVDTDHIIFLEGDDFGRKFELFHEPQDPQLAYAVHYYPFVYESGVLDPDMPDEERFRIFDEIFYRQLRARERFHRPIWCGECGLEHHPDIELYNRMMAYVLGLCEKNNVSWTLWSYKDARTMSIVMPKEDSAWMRFTGRIAARWGHHRETAQSEETLRHAIDSYFEPISDEQFYEIEFRMRSIFHRLAVETVLKKELRATPWEEMREMPKDFLFQNCDRYDHIADCIRGFIAAKENE